MDSQDLHATARRSGASGGPGSAGPPGPSTQPFAAALQEVHAHTLANGLRLLVWPTHAIPNIALNNWVHVGSRNEHEGASGLAHFFEHMMFNGTARHTSGEFDRLLEAQGASNNAYTSQDVTVYQDWLPASALELVLELEADRLAHLQFDAQVVENERRVVLSERRLRVDDSNAARLDEQVQASAFSQHPYRIPTIGWLQDIESWTLSDLQRFYETYYAASNCTLLLVGDVQVPQALELVERYFGALPRRAPPPSVTIREPPQRAERRIELPRAGQNTLLQLAYHALAANDARAPALHLLQTILLGGNASRLHQRLVEQRQLAVSINGGWSEGFDPNLFTLQATLPQGLPSERFEQALEAELTQVRESGVSASELQRAKNLIAADFWRAVATIDGKARLLGEYAVMHGDYRTLFGAPASYEEVSAAQVKAMAQLLFNNAHRTVGLLPAHSS